VKKILRAVRTKSALNQTDAVERAIEAWDI
jgi:hypothetical protein